MDIRAISSAIVAAINQGAPIYNTGNIAECARLYRETAKKILNDGATGFPAERLREALEFTEGTADEQAWALRHAFDAILDTARGRTPRTGSASNNIRTHSEASTTTAPPPPPASISSDAAASLPSLPTYTPMVSSRPMRLSDVASAIIAAINKGAPTYNLGDIAGCALLYRNTAKRLLSEGAMGYPRECLTTALERDAAFSSVDEQAWTLRHAFDSILGFAEAQEDAPDREPVTGDEVLSDENLIKSGM